VQGDPPGLLSDGKLMIVTRLIESKPQGDRLARGGGLHMVSEWKARKTWRGWIRKQQITVKPDGFERELGSETIYRLLVGVRTSKLEVWVNGHRMDVLRCARVRYNRITHPRGPLRTKSMRPVIFWQGKRPVALLMGLWVGDTDPRTVAKETEGDQK